MADRYWVGGAGSWNTTAKWSATSGGASGASVPTSADNAIFDSNSGTGTAHYIVTVTDNATCANLTFTPETDIGATEFAVGNGFVIAGTFSTSGTAGNRRAWFRSSVYGFMRDMQIAAIGSVSDVDFQDIRVTGTGGTLSGTRIGDLRGCSGITFSAPKTVYWNLTTGGNWSADAWAATSGATVSTDNFPLAQDTAVIENAGLNTSATITLDTAIPRIGTIDMSGRTLAMTLAKPSAYTVYGNWKYGSGVILSGAGVLTFSGRNTQIITSAGKEFTAITIDSFGGTVELADALNMSIFTLTVTNGTFDTKGYTITTGQISSTSTNVRSIKLRSSTVTNTSATPFIFTTSTNLSFDSGTSNIILSDTSGSLTLSGAGFTFYNVTVSAGDANQTITGNNTFNDLTFTAPASNTIRTTTFSGDQIINGTLTCSGGSAIRRRFLLSNTTGTQRNLTVGTLVANDSDFRDIKILGAAAGSSPTRAGDCGGNSGIVFPAAKTVYWNLAGNNSWNATGWAATSGGTPDVDNFPLAQDTAVFDNTGSFGTMTLGSLVDYNLKTLDASQKTTTWSFTSTLSTLKIHGNILLSPATTGDVTFDVYGISNQYITSNGVTMLRLQILSPSANVLLNDAMIINDTSSVGLALFTGGFDANGYNVTISHLSSSFTNTRTLRLGSGLWTITGSASCWALGSTNLVFYKDTADIVLSSTSTTARTFAGGGLPYNKLTIGGTTGTSTTTITGTNTFGELASTKTVAHTIAFGTASQTLGKWTITGTVGNVVTLTGTASFWIAGPRVEGVNYLAMGSIGLNGFSSGEFYAGANSTGTGGGPRYNTAAPAATTRYWVGGTGTWNSTLTTNWSATSGGSGGASVPTSADDVVFNSASSGASYTVTVGTGGRQACKSITMSGPATGTLTWAGTTAPLNVHGDITMAATGVTRTYNGNMYLAGSTGIKTITTNGVAWPSSIILDNIGGEWALGSAFPSTSGITVTHGTFNANGYNLTCTGGLSSDNAVSRGFKFGTGTSTISGSVNFGTTAANRANLVVDKGTSQINMTGTAPTFAGNNQEFHNVSFTSTAITTVTMTGQNTFNNLLFTGLTASGTSSVTFSDNQIINDSLTISGGGTAAICRSFLLSNSIGTTRTLTCGSVSAIDVDFRDITIAGAAAPVSGTRLGDCKGNSGITFDAAKTVYWANTLGALWNSLSWSDAPTNAASHAYFPLAQDTAIFSASVPNSTSTLRAITMTNGFNIGTIDMSARVGTGIGRIRIDTGTATLNIYGNWINGTGTENPTGVGFYRYAGRNAQTITSAGKYFTQTSIIDSPGGSVTLQDAYLHVDNNPFNFISGTFNANIYNVSITNGTSPFIISSTAAKTINFGSGVWTLAGRTNVFSHTGSNTTILGTGTISLTNINARTFAGGGLSYSGITLNQASQGALTITGDNTFKDITSTYSATGATSILLGATIQKVSQFTASGTAGKLLTITGTGSGAKLILTGSTKPNVDYLVLTLSQAYPVNATWYAGNNSTNRGTLGWYFEVAPTPPAASPSTFFLMI